MTVRVINTILQHLYNNSQYNSTIASIIVISIMRSEHRGTYILRGFQFSSCGALDSGSKLELICVVFFFFWKLFLVYLDYSVCAYVYVYHYSIFDCEISFIFLHFFFNSKTYFVSKNLQYCFCCEQNFQNKTKKIVVFWIS